MEGDDLAGDGGGHFHRSLVGHHVDEGGVFLDEVADLDVPGDDFGFGGAFADVGELEDELAHGLQASIVRRRAATTRAGPGKYSHSKAWG